MMNLNSAKPGEAAINLEADWTNLSPFRRHAYFYTVLILITVLWASWRSSEPPGLSKHGQTAVERIQEVKTLVASFE